uniref:Uncharacterized protein n=1 Tax=Canis lupus dingo TaxID=286419 RepID=A0A8C0LN02_CANLU
MKLRVPAWSVSDSTDSNRFIFSHTLYIRHINSLLISYSHLSRRQLRLNHLLYTCKRSLHILYLPFYTRRMRTILWLLCIHRNMKYWNNSLICNYSHSIHRLCPTMKTNILLRSNCHHKPTLSNPLHRD